MLGTNLIMSPVTSISKHLATEVSAISLNFSPGSLKEEENWPLPETQIWLPESSFP
jgi:hypothetical protein